MNTVALKQPPPTDLQLTMLLDEVPRRPRPVRMTSGKALESQLAGLVEDCKVVPPTERFVARLKEIAFDPPGCWNWRECVDHPGCESARQKMRLGQELLGMIAPEPEMQKAG